MRICRARVRIASSSARFSASPTGTARPPDWRKPATFSARASSDGSEMKTVTRNGPAPSTLPQPVTSSPENGSARSTGRNDSMSSEACQRKRLTATWRSTSPRLRNRSKKLSSLISLLLVAPLQRPLLLQLGVAGAAGKRGENRGRQADCTHVRQEPRPVGWHHSRGV